MPDEIECDLNRRLLTAHRDGDSRALVGLYGEAAEFAEKSEQAARSDFFLTQSWIHALETGDPRAEELRNRLKARGRVD